MTQQEQGRQEQGQGQGQEVRQIKPTLSLLEDLPDALILQISSYFPAKELSQIECVSKRFRSVDYENLWQSQCEQRWMDWPRYRWSVLSLSHPHLGQKTWKQRYVWVENDHGRTMMTEEELTGSRWYFNFTPQAGGRGRETMESCQFTNGFMFLRDYHPLPYELVTVSQEDAKQVVVIWNFPVHPVDRLDNGEWLITNDYVTLVSCVGDEEPTYKERGFQ